MFKNWTKLFTSDCRVIRLTNGQNIFPIFKNAQTSLFDHAKENKCRIFINNEISELKNISVFLRDPVERFISGIHTVIELEKIENIDGYLEDVKNFRQYNRHYTPQFFWLLHLSKYFKKQIRIEPVHKLLSLIPERSGPPVDPLTPDRREKISSSLENGYIDIDKLLIKKYMGQASTITQIIRDLRPWTVRD